MTTRFFRAGVGTVIYNAQGEVAIFERAQHPVGIWQFQQGGMDSGESIYDTLWRELKEEVGLIKAQIKNVDEMPLWTVYQDYQTDIDHSIERIGQAHKWFFLKLKDEVEINLANATDREFSDFRWTTFSDAVAITHDRKRHVYEELHHYFTKEVLE